MNLFADLLATTQAAQGQTTATGPRIQKRRGVEIKSAREVKIMRQASKIVATVLREVMAMVEPGQTTGDLDAFAERRIREMGATPSFKGYHGFPASICPVLTTRLSMASPVRSV
jgi:methionyl aminopeptidase